MKVTLTLEGRDDTINALVSMVVAEGVLLDFSVVEQEQKPTRRKASTTAPFSKAQRVCKANQTKNSPIPRFATGSVHDTRRARAGWSVLVRWDDPAYGEDWIAAARLLPVE